MTKENIHDQAFKELIEECFKEFMELFWPEESKQIDFRTVHFLQQEMSTDHGPGKGKERKMDIVAEVKIRGETRHIMIHIEHQNKRESNFPQRMFNYYCQLWLRHQKPIFPIALFSDDHKWIKPINDFFEIKALDKKVVLFNYELIKLKNLNWRDYINSSNPIVAALMAKMGFNTEEIPRVKAEIARILTGRSFKYQKLGYLANFSEFYLPLPDKKSIFEYKSELSKLGVTEDIEEMLVLSKPVKERYEAGIKKKVLKKVLNKVFRKVSKKHTFQMHQKCLKRA